MDSPDYGRGLLYILGGWLAFGLVILLKWMFPDEEE